MNLQHDVAITDLLKAGGFTLSAEIVPPRNGVSPTVIFNQISALRDSGANFLSVTRGAGGSLRGGTLPISQIVKEQFRLPCISHFTCRDLLPEEVESQLIDHYFFGIRNILALRGDPPTEQKDWQPRPGSHSHAYKLVEQIRALNEGKYLERSGFKVESREKTQFCIGVACYPDHSDPWERIVYFRLKVEAGAHFAISQMLFDADSYARFIDECAENGLDIPVLPGVRILKSRTQARRMAKRFGIPLLEKSISGLPETDAESSPERSLEAFLELTERFKSKGAQGVHVFVLNDTELACTGMRELDSRNRSNGPRNQHGLVAIS